MNDEINKQLFDGWMKIDNYTMCWEKRYKTMNSWIFEVWVDMTYSIAIENVEKWWITCEFHDIRYPCRSGGVSHVERKFGQNWNIMVIITLKMTRVGDLMAWLGSQSIQSDYKRIGKSCHVDYANQTKVDVDYVVQTMWFGLVRLILKTLLKRNKFYLSCKKTHFFVDMVNDGMDVLGRHIRNSEISIAKAKVNAFTSLQTPRLFKSSARI